MDESHFLSVAWKEFLGAAAKCLLEHELNEPWPIIVR